MIKQWIAFVVTLSLTLMLTTSVLAKVTKKDGKKGTTVTGVAVQVTKTMIVVDTGSDKPKRVSAQLSDATTYTGAELVQGATVTVTLKDGKATSVEVQAATK